MNDPAYNPPTPILNGQRLLLRPPQDSDKADRLACGRDPEFRRMVGGDPNVCPPLTLEEVEQWYAQMCSEPLHWIIEAEGRCIGTTRLHQLDMDNRRTRYAIGIFDPAMWGKRLGTEATRLVLGYAFDVLGLHRVDLRVLAFNHRAIACYTRCGFTVEGVEREGALIGDEWQSDVLMTLLRFPAYKENGMAMTKRTTVERRDAFRGKINQGYRMRVLFRTLPDVLRYKTRPYVGVGKHTDGFKLRLGQIYRVRVALLARPHVSQAYPKSSGVCIKLVRDSDGNLQASGEAYYRTSP